MSQAPKEVIFVFKKSDSEEVRFSIGDYRGKTYLDMRVFFHKEGESDMIPSKKGLTLPVDALPELREGLEKAEQKSPAAVHALN